MVWHQDAGKHDIHNGSVIRNENVWFAFIFFLVRKIREVISQTHTVEHPETPDADKFVSVFVMLFIEGENINRDSYCDC